MLSERLFGRTETQERSASDVDALIAAYKSPESTRTLMEFGQSLLRANDDRVSAIESKATSLVGYSTAILAFLVTLGPSFSATPTWKAILILLAGGLAAVACVNAGLVLRAARDWKNPGEATWFPEDVNVVDDPDRLRRWYLSAMHESLQHNHRITNDKAGEMISAQLAVAGAGTCLALSLAVDAFTALIR